MAYTAMAYIVVAYTRMAYIVMAYRVMACTVMAYIVMADVVMTDIVMTHTRTSSSSSRISFCSWAAFSIIFSSDLIRRSCELPSIGHDYKGHDYIEVGFPFSPSLA